jgi:carnitine 3-dehydrogenase
MPNNETLPRTIKRVGLVGLGTVGCGWAAAYIAKGFDVVASDVAPEAWPRCELFLQRAWPALRRLGQTDHEEPPLHCIQFGTEINAVAGCDIVHENAPEDVHLKRRMLATIENVTGPQTIIASSTGGILPSLLQSQMTHPQRMLVVHPFNPPHLVPLVEIVGGAATDPEIIDFAMQFMRMLGKHPIRLNKEAIGFLTNRLQFALLREAVHCLAEGIASAEAIEAAMQFGLAPRWAAVGSLTTLTLSGGEDGIAAVINRFSGAFESWWASLGAPSLTPDVCAKLIRGSEEITRGMSLAEWATRRDKRLVDILTALSKD